MKKLFLALLISVISVCAYSQSNSKNEKINQLLELTGSGKLGVQVAQNMISTFQQSYKNVDQKFWVDFASEIKSDDLIKIIVPIYDKYYTEDDIDQIIAFYKTPIGEKMIQTLPMVSMESMTAGQEWGKKIAEKVIRQLKEKGYLNQK